MDRTLVVKGSVMTNARVVYTPVGACTYISAGGGHAEREGLAEGGHAGEGGDPHQGQRLQARPRRILRAHMSGDACLLAWFVHTCGHVMSPLAFFGGKNASDRALFEQ